MPSRKPPDRRRTFILFLALVAALSACVRTPRAGVSVKALAADLVFGIPPLPESVPPPDFTLEPEQPKGVLKAFDRGSRQRPDLTTAPPLEACGEAGPTDFPEKEATPNVTDIPKNGIYKWVNEGVQKVTAVGDYIPPKLTTRIIRVTQVSPTADTFFFEAIEKELSYGSSTHVDLVFSVVQSGGTEDGIYLIEIDRIVEGKRTVFNPAPPILILPLPVRIGVGRPETQSVQGYEPIKNTSFTTTGVDPRTQEVLEHTGSVTKRQRVDACGELVDSWFVDGYQKFTSSQGRSFERNYDYGVATQLGGFIVFEHIDSPPTSPTLMFEHHLGTLRPEPLPGG